MLKRLVLEIRMRVGGIVKIVITSLTSFDGLNSAVYAKVKKKKVSSVKYGIHVFTFCKEKKGRSHTGIIKKVRVLT